MEISAKNQIRGKVKTVIHGNSYSQIAIEQTDADGIETGSFIHAAIPVDIAKKMKLENNEAQAAERIRIAEEKLEIARKKK